LIGLADQTYNMRSEVYRYHWHAVLQTDCLKSPPPPGVAVLTLSAHFESTYYCFGFTLWPWCGHSLL